jgi:alpha-mannosidase/chitodextrinase
MLTKSALSVSLFAVVIPLLLVISASPGTAQENQVYVITGAHQDLAGPDTWMMYSNQLRDHIGLIERQPGVRFCMGNTFNVKHFLQVYPEYEDRLRRLMRQGKISSPAEWVDFEPGWYSGEFVVRSIAYAKYWLKSTLGYDSHWAHLNDVPSITPQFAQVLEKSDVSLLVANNQRLGYPRAGGRMFDYHALDGSKVLVYMVGYNDLLYLCSELNLNYLLKEYKLQNNFGPLKLKLEQAITDLGTEVHLSRGLLRNCQRWNQKYAKQYNFTLHFKTIEDFAKEIKRRIAEQGLKLPQMTGIRDPWPWAGQHTGTSLDAGRQRAAVENMLPTVEKLSAIDELLGIAAYPAEEINRAWEHILWPPDHNWGWKDKIETHQRAYELVQRLLKQKLAEFASAVKWESKGVPIVVFNPLNWARSEVVEVSVRLDEGLEWAVTEHSGKPVLFQQLDSRNNGDGTKTVRLLFKAADVPSVGYKTFYIVAKDGVKPLPPANLTAGKGYIANGYYKISADKARGLTSIYDKRGKRELINSKSTYPFGFSALAYSSLEKRVVRINHIESSSGPLRAELKLTGTLLDYPVTIQLRLWAGSPRIDISVSIDYEGFKSNATYRRIAKSDFPDERLVLKLLKEGIIRSDESNPDYVYFDDSIRHKGHLKKRLEQTGIKEIKSVLAVWQRFPDVKQQHHAFILPFNLPDYSMQLGIPYGSVPNLRPTRGTSAKLSRRSPPSAFILGGTWGGKGRFELSGWHRDIQKWFSIGNASYSVDVALVNLETRTYMLNNDRKLPAVHLLRWLNSQKYNWRLSLRGHRGDWREADAPRFGWECSNPLLAVVPSGRGWLPPEASFISIDAPAGNIVLSTFKQAFDGNGYVLRFYETEDRDTRVRVEINPLLNIPRDEVSRTNLLEDPIEVLPASAEAHSIRTLGYGIETLRFFKTAVTDVIRPAAVNDLRLENPTSVSLDLVWTASGDDGKKGTAHEYQIGYSTQPINEQNWDKISKVEHTLKPKAAGSPESFRVSGLMPRTSYYFAIRVVDEAGNRSSLSNVARASTQEPDNIPPAAISDLSVVNSSATAVTLTWTTPGDDQFQGRAASYELRYSTEMIDATTWEDATPVDRPPRPGSPKSQARYTVSGLEPATTYYFAIRAVDEVGNSSFLSNVASGQTVVLKQVVLQNGLGGYAGTEDTHLSHVNEEESVMVYGESQTVRTWAGGVRSVLIKFDLSSIPTQAKVYSATLGLYCYDITYGDEGTAQCYRLTADWDQHQANWWRRDKKHKWGAKGGGQIDATTDYGLGPNGMIAVSGVKDGGGWVRFSVTPVVRAWLAGKYPNFGWLIMGNCDQNCGMYYHSSEYRRNPKLRPRLEIKYDLP